MAEQQKSVLLEMVDYWTALGDKIERGENVDAEVSLIPIAEQLKKKNPKSRRPHC